MQDFFSGIFCALENRYIRPCPAHSNATALLPEKNASKTTAGIKVGRNDEPPLRGIWPNLRSGTAVVGKPWRYVSTNPKS